MEYFYSGVLLLNLLAALMVFARPKLYKTRLYRPMVKNIFLSVLPVVVLAVTFMASINIAYRGYQTGQRAWVYVGFACGLLGLAVWLLLLPNAGYLITELNLNHRTRDKAEVPLWYDIISVLTLSMSGVVNTLMNVMLVQMLYIGLFYPTTLSEVRFSTHPILWLMMICIFVLVSFGIYIGRYIRFNSWDVLNPLRMLRKFVHHAKEPGAVKNMLLFTLFYTLFFFVLYLVVVVPLFEGYLVWL